MFSKAWINVLHCNKYGYIHIYIYIYAFSRRFYPKRLTVHSGYTCFICMCVPWESNPQPFALLTQCSTTEPQEHILEWTSVTTKASLCRSKPVSRQHGLRVQHGFDSKWFQLAWRESSSKGCIKHYTCQPHSSSLPEHEAPWTHPSAAQRGGARHA